ncbi:hypothetical protein ACKC9G_05445 [Pokkaliibacter sp. CJK22405]|uniref:hypothetical protein n=1 Tax=Pokkaliibacter sp. CJK22405 TaxID=3384615 RepID=UPI003984A2D0
MDSSALTRLALVTKTPFNTAPGLRRLKMDFLGEALEGLLGGVGRAVGWIIFEFFFWTVCYWVGWPICRILTWGRYPHYERVVFMDDSRDDPPLGCAVVGFLVIVLACLSLAAHFSSATP